MQMVSTLRVGSQIKRSSPFQVGNNKINRDVKGLFLSVRFVSSRVIIISWLGCSSRTSCMSRCYGRQHLPAQASARGLSPSA